MNFIKCPGRGVVGYQFGWFGFRWIETPNWRRAGTVYLGFIKIAW